MLTRLIMVANMFKTKCIRHEMLKKSVFKQLAHLLRPIFGLVFIKDGFSLGKK